MVEYIILYAGGVLISSVSQALLKYSAIRNSGRGIKEYANLFVISAYALLFISLFISSIAIRYFQASIAPVIESTSYIFILIIGRWFFQESITTKKIIGIILVMIGIIVFNIKI